MLVKIPISSPPQIKYFRSLNTADNVVFFPKYTFQLHHTRSNVCPCCHVAFSLSQVLSVRLAVCICILCLLLFFEFFRVFLVFLFFLRSWDGRANILGVSTSSRVVFHCCWLLICTHAKK